MKLYTANKETGAFIEEVRSIIDGQNTIRLYEERDREDGAFTDGFYDIVNEEHESVEQETTLYADYDNDRFFEIVRNNGSGLNWCIEYGTDEDGYFVITEPSIGMTDRELKNLDLLEV